MSTLEQASDLTKALENELANARASWSVFSGGNGKNSSDRSDLRSLVNNTYENHTYQHILRSAATMTVLSICRLSDPAKTERVTLCHANRLIGPAERVEEIANAAASWFVEHPERSEEDRKWAQTEAPQLNSDIKTFIKSEELKRVRALRNEALAHNLTAKTVRPTYSDIENVFDVAHRLVSRLSLLIDGRHWDPTDFQSVQEKYANEFWDRFEDGLRDRSATRS